MSTLYVMLVQGAMTFYVCENLHNNTNKMILHNASLRIALHTHA